MAGITVYVYLKGEKTPVPISNCTAINLRAAVDVKTGETYRNQFVSPIVISTVPGTATTLNTFVGGGHALPNSHNTATLPDRLIAIDDVAMGRPPQVTVAKRDQITFTTSPAILGTEKIFAWRDEVLCVSNCDINNVPPNVAVWYLKMKGYRRKIPFINVTAIDGSVVTINQGQVYRNTLPGGTVVLVDVVSTKTAYVNADNGAQPASHDSSSAGRLVAVDDLVGAKAPRPLISAADVLTINTSDTAALGDTSTFGDTALCAWRSKVIMTSYTAP